MRAKLTRIISRLFSFLKPVVNLIDKGLTVPFSIKKINGDHYYMWRDKIFPCMVLLTNVKGVGSNLLNPSDIKHGAFYYGRNLKSDLASLLRDLISMQDIAFNSRRAAVIDRLLKFYSTNDLDDSICYVIEAIGKGTVATNLVKFMTTKDLFKAVRFKQLDEQKIKAIKTEALMSLGLPYDYGFNHDDSAKYCFEVAADAFEKGGGYKLKRHEYKLFGAPIYDVFMADTFLDQQWEVVIDSEVELS